LTAGGTTRLTRTGCDANTESLTRSAISPFTERFLGNSPSPRVSVGFGVNWNSPFGPFRIDIARAILHEPGDDTTLFTFNVGTAF
jgi:outer membrane protein insertion porin family